MSIEYMACAFFVIWGAGIIYVLQRHEAVHKFRMRVMSTYGAWYFNQLPSEWQMTMSFKRLTEKNYLRKIQEVKP